MAPAQKRRIRLIDPRFQFRLVAAFLLVQLLLTAVFGFALRAFFASELSANLSSAHARVQNLSELLFPIVAMLSAGSFLVSIILTTLLVVRLSHRLAGPLFRFRVVLEALGHRVVPVHTAIRPEDQFQEVAASLAGAVGVLADDLQALRQSSTAARMSLERGEPQEAARHLEDLEHRLSAWHLEP